MENIQHATHRPSIEHDDLKNVPLNITKAKGDPYIQNMVEIPMTEGKKALHKAMKNESKREICVKTIWFGRI